MSAASMLDRAQPRQSQDGSGTRLARAQALADRGEITRSGNTFYVPSASSENVYRVTLDGDRVTCTCRDYQARGESCKHVYACCLVVAKAAT